jgi:putative transposase
LEFRLQAATAAQEMYNWRKMSEAEREEVFVRRQLRGGSWRRPPVWNPGEAHYMITAACYEHHAYIGKSPGRISNFEADLLAEIDLCAIRIHAHVILPNHYHVLVETGDVVVMRERLGQLHGRTSFHWNKEDDAKGRKVFHGSAETVMRSERHFQATINYIHHNPVKHGYVKQWQDWPYSTARQYLSAVGREEAILHWQEYPVDRYGDEWDL